MQYIFVVLDITESIIIDIYIGSDSTAASGISLGIRTPGAPLGLTASSGYVGDKSSMYSHSTQKVSRFAQGGTASLQAEQVFFEIFIIS